jgi:hypothetical protein
MAGAASAHQAATATHEETSQQRAGRRRRTSADPQRAQQGATAAAADGPAALHTLSRLQQLANASPQVAQLRRLQALGDGRNAPVAQLAGGPEEEELVQGRFATAQLQPQLQLQQAPRANNTGLPDQLKSGIESLSGLSMDHVRVHYNSSQPAQLNALAYAQGSDIHLAPGQERHLPHEAWHVVQQAQGRVRPTLQMKDGVQVNDDVGLECEADVMGTKALEGGHRVDETHGSISMPIETPKRIDADTTKSSDMKVVNNDSAQLANGRDSTQRVGNEVRRQVQAWGDGSERVRQLRAWQEVADGKGGKRQELTTGLVVMQLLGGEKIESRQVVSRRVDPDFATYRGAAVVAVTKVEMQTFYDRFVANEVSRLSAMYIDDDVKNTMRQADLLFTLFMLNSNNIGEIQTRLSDLVVAVNAADDNIDTLLVNRNHIAGTEEAHRDERYRRTGAKPVVGTTQPKTLRGVNSHAEGEQLLTNLHNAVNGALGGGAFVLGQVGVRGSAVTGIRSRTNTPFEEGTDDNQEMSNASDLDFFFTCPGLEAQIRRTQHHLNQGRRLNAGGTMSAQYLAGWLNLGAATNGYAASAALLAALTGFTTAAEALTGRKSDVTFIGNPTAATLVGAADTLIR